MIKRTLETCLSHSVTYFKSLYLSGPRGVGKTTLLRSFAAAKRKLTTLDEKKTLDLVLDDPEMFFNRYPIPVQIDEIQKAPQFFLGIKMELDRNPEKKNMLWLTGSQKIKLMKNVGDTLAGRVLIADMYGLSQAEKQNDPERPSFLPAFNGPETCDVNPDSVLEDILAGSFPESFRFAPRERRLWFSSYVRTYIERDLPDIIEVRDNAAFEKFLGIVALRTGQLLNYTSLANSVGVNDKTIRSWLTALESYGLIYLLRPYSNSNEKRLVKTPKLYFMDTGLAAFLAGIRNKDEFTNSRMAGALFETYVISEIIKGYTNHLITPRLCFYRDSQQHEIDLIIEDGGKLYPVEIKMNGTPRPDMAASFSFIPEEDRGMGAVICLSCDKFLIKKDAIVMPVGML